MTEWLEVSFASFTLHAKSYDMDSSKINFWFSITSEKNLHVVHHK